MENGKIGKASYHWPVCEEAIIDKSAEALFVIFSLGVIFVFQTVSFSATEFV